MGGPRASISSFTMASEPCAPRDPDRLVRAVVAHLSAYEPVADGLVRLRGVPLVRDGEALLACLAARSSFDLLERRLNANGLLLVDEPFVVLDPAAAELVVAEPDLAVDRRALARAATVVGGKRRQEPSVSPGRYRVSRWAYVVPDEQGGASCEPLLPWALIPGSRGDVGALTALAEQVRPTAVSWDEVASGAWCDG
jgi:hypothetical protein